MSKTSPQMNHLVKIITDEDGEPAEPLWHVVYSKGGSNVLACSLEVFGFGEGAAISEVKYHPRGITCDECKDVVRFFKGVKL